VDTLERVKFSEAYNLANHVWTHVIECSPSEEFDDLFAPSDAEVLSRIIRPRRDSLLHLFLRRIYWQHYVWAFEHHRNDMLDLVVADYEAVLTFNEVHFKRRSLPSEAAENFERVTKRRIAYLRRLLPVTRIAQDTFQLLFRDRAFLRQFGVLVARTVEGCANGNSSHLLTRQGHVRRTSLPAWLRRGVFYRDNGRCVACGSDLTGKLMNGTAVHFDHIVPLAKRGSNDPTNFQLLCDRCNRTKWTEVDTWERYPVFWMAAAANDDV